MTDTDITWLSTTDASKRLYVSAETLRRWDRQGRVPEDAVMRSGKSHRLWREDWVAQQSGQQPDLAHDQLAQAQTLAVIRTLMFITLPAIMLLLLTAFLTTTTPTFEGIDSGLGGQVSGDLTVLQAVYLAVMFVPMTVGLWIMLAYLVRLCTTWSMAAMARPKLLRAAARALWASAFLLFCSMPLGSAGQSVAMGQDLSWWMIVELVAGFALVLVVTLPIYVITYLTLRRMDACAPLKDWNISQVVESLAEKLTEARPRPAHHYPEDDLWVVRWFRRRMEAHEQMDARLEGRLPAD